MPLEESQAAMEAGWYCWVTHTGWRHHCSLSLSLRASACSWTRERPQRGQPFECLMHQVIEKDPIQGCSLNAYCAKQGRRTSQGIPLNESCWKWEKGSSVQFSSVQLLSCVWLFATPWTTTGQASLSITNSRSRPKSMSIKSVMPSNHLILCRPLLLLPSIFPSIIIFSNESALCIGSI